MVRGGIEVSMGCRRVCTLHEGWLEEGIGGWWLLGGRWVLMGKGLGETGSRGLPGA